MLSLLFIPVCKVYPETKVGYRLTAVIDSDKYSKFLLGFVNWVCTKAYLGKETVAPDTDLTQVKDNIIFIN